MTPEQCQSIRLLQLSATVACTASLRTPFPCQSIRLLQLSATRVQRDHAPVAQTCQSIRLLQLSATRRIQRGSRDADVSVNQVVTA